MSEDEQVRLLREILKWIRLSGWREAKTVLMGVLNEPQKLLAYHLSDGTRSTVEISRNADFATGTIANYWQTWQRQGLGESVPVKGGDRFKRSFDLQELGIDVPSLSEIRQAKRVKSDGGS